MLSGSIKILPDVHTYIKKMHRQAVACFCKFTVFSLVVIQGLSMSEKTEFAKTGHNLVPSAIDWQVGSKQWLLNYQLYLYFLFFKSSGHRTQDMDWQAGRKY